MNMNQDTRTRLLETALRLIWTSNYNAVGVNDICKAAGVTKGGFYHHFETKAHLFCEASSYYWEKIKKDLDAILSPVNSPLEQLESMIVFIYVTKFGDDPSCIPGNPFFSAGIQSGCGEAIVNESLQLMAENGVKYTQALVRSLQAGGYLEGDGDAEQIARLICQYLQGATSLARVSCGCLQTAKRDVAIALYRLMGLKREYWFSAKATWPPAPAALNHS